MEDQEADNKPTTKIKTSRIRMVSQKCYLSIFYVFLAFLSFMYLIHGDLSAFGENITIWPSSFWLLGLVPLCIALKFTHNIKYAGLGLLALLGFFIATEEWGSLIRFKNSAAIERWQTLRSPLQESNKYALRIVTWNVDSKGSKQVLPVLEYREPDICFLQETSDGKGSVQPEDLTGYWQGFHWLDTGDCGILSRYPVKLIENGRVGPWSAPLFAEMMLPDGRKVLLINVRLMLPNLNLDYFTPSQHNRFVDHHRARVEQYSKLAAMIESNSYDTVILAGDFNVSGTAHSLEPIRNTLIDSWKTCGQGWGRTILADFPMSRIDQIWVSDDIEPVHGTTAEEPFSDHRSVTVDIIL